MTVGPILAAEEIAALESFRAAARQVSQASIIASGKTLSIEGKYRPSGELEVEWRLLEDEPFRSLAIAIRLVYQQGEPSNFNRIANILWKVGTEAQKLEVSRIRKEYSATLQSPVGVIVANVGDKVQQFSSRDVLETWMYGGVFHQDQERQEASKALTHRPEAFTFSVQATAIQLAGRILDLDDVAANILKQPALPRIATTT